MSSNHITRESWYMSKPIVAEQWGWGKSILGGFDSAFLFLYALGLFVCGNVEDKMNMRLVLPAGMTISGIALCLVAVFGFYDSPTIWAFMILWAVAGFFQAVVWPGTVNTIGNWFSARNKGAVMGIFSSSNNVGNLLGAFIFYLLGVVAQLSWSWVMLISACTQFLVAALFAIFVSERPSGEARLVIRDLSDSFLRVDDNLGVVQKKAGISFFQAWCIPGVAIYAIVFACLKLVNYGMMMWLPFYTREGLGRGSGDVILLANLFDVGSVIGAVVLGLIMDNTTFRSTIMVPMMLIAIPVYSSFMLITNDYFTLYYFLVPLIGVLIGGSSNLTSSLVSSDLASRPDLKVDAMSTVTGIIDGTGSFGAAVGQIVIGLLANGLGWDATFIFLMVICFIPCVLLTPVIIQECREHITRKKDYYNEYDDVFR